MKLNTALVAGGGEADCWDIFIRFVTQWCILDSSTQAQHTSFSRAHEGWHVCELAKLKYEGETSWEVLVI